MGWGGGQWGGVVFVFAVVDLQICGQKIIPLQQPTGSTAPSSPPFALHCNAVHPLLALPLQLPLLPSHHPNALHCVNERTATPTVLSDFPAVFFHICNFGICHEIQLTNTDTKG